MRTWLLCLLLFLLVRMLFSNVSIWELNCQNLKGSQVITIFKWEMYGRILFTYLLTLSSNVFSLGPNFAIFCALYHVSFKFLNPVRVK